MAMAICIFCDYAYHIKILKCRLRMNHLKLVAFSDFDVLLISLLLYPFPVLAIFKP